MKCSEKFYAAKNELQNYTRVQDSPVSQIR